MSSWYMNLEGGPLGSVGVLTPLESNFKVDSTFYYRESTALQYPMLKTTRHYVLGFVTYYPLHSVSPWTDILSLTRWKLSTFQEYIYYPWVINPPIMYLADMF